MHRSPRLVDEYGSLPCDDLLGRLDMFFFELGKDPGSTGLVVIYRPKVHKRQAVFRQHMIAARAKDREFTSNKIRFVRSDVANRMLDQLWLIPAGASEPEIKNIDTTYTVPNDAGPFMLGVEYSNADGICPEVDHAMVFAEFLKGNPGSRGNIVVRERSIRQAGRQVERMRKEFRTRTRYGVPSSRLRFFPRTAW